MEVKQNLRYTPDHEWVKLTENGNATVGITDFAQNELGDIVYIDIETVGQHVEQGVAFGSVEAVKTVSELFMPISGKVIAVNPSLNDQPEMVNADPYGEGWMIEIEPDNAADIDALLSADAYMNLIAP